MPGGVAGVRPIMAVPYADWGLCRIEREALVISTRDWGVPAALGSSMSESELCSLRRLARPGHGR